MTNITADYDEPWKEAIGQYLEQFLIFFFPKIHAKIDWRSPYRSLEKELSELVGNSETGKRFPDKLFEVKLLTKKTVWVLIHVEVQSQYESDFSERIYVYNYRAFDKYRKRVISLAILGDDNPDWRPHSYTSTLGNYKLSLKFPTVKLLDYEPRWSELLESDNPFAIMVMAHLKTKATTRDFLERKQWKWTVVRTLLSKGYSRDEVVNLFRFIDKMMTLPKTLQQAFKTELTQSREEKIMPFISPFEEMVKEEGREESRVLTLREETIAVLEIRFNTVPPEVVDALNGIENADILRRLHRQAVVIPSVPEFQQLIAELSHS